MKAEYEREEHKKHKFHTLRSTNSTLLQRLIWNIFYEGNQESVQYSGKKKQLERLEETLFRSDTTHDSFS